MRSLYGIAVRLSLVCVLMSGGIGPAAAAGAAGGSAGAALTVTPDPKAVAMGEGAVADISNLPAVAVNNPARLLGVTRPWASFSTLSLPQGMGYHFASFAMPTAYGSIGTSFGFLDYGDIDGRKANGDPSDVPGSHDAQILLSYALPLRVTVPVRQEYGAIGASLKFYQSKLAEYSAEAIAVDLGGVFYVPYIEGATFGIAYRNIGSGLKMVRETASLPTGLDFGFGYRRREWKDFSAALDFYAPSEGPGAVSLGFSFSPLYFLSLRAGYRSMEDSLASGVRAGFGVEFGDFTLDYACIPFSRFGNLHTVGINVAVGNILHKETAADHYLRQHFNDAREHYYRGDYITARKSFEDILSVYPDHAPSKEYLGKIVSALEKQELQRDRKIAEWLRKATAAIEKRDFVRARMYYANILELRPGYPDAQIGLTTLSRLMDEVEQERARQRNRETIRRIWDVAVKRFRDGDFVKAKEEFSRILTIDPGNEEAKEYVVEIDTQLSKIAASRVNELYEQAARLYRDGRYEEAIKYFEAVLVAAPHRMDAQEAIESSRLKIREAKDRVRAEELARRQKAVREEMQTVYEKALKHYEKGQFGAALRYFMRSRELVEKYEFDEYREPVISYISMLKSTLAEQHYKNGFEAFRKNRFEEAAAEYRAALKYNPDNVAARVELERIHRDLARKYFEKGMAYYSRSEMDKAREMFDKALSFDPDMIEAKRARERTR